MPGATGIWVGPNKIAAIGVKISHGFRCAVACVGGGAGRDGCTGRGGAPYWGKAVRMQSPAPRLTILLVRPAAPSRAFVCHLLLPIPAPSPLSWPVCLRAHWRPHCSRSSPSRCSSHGFALNVGGHHGLLPAFEAIVPCGITAEGKGVTSMEAELRRGKLRRGTQGQHAQYGQQQQQQQQQQQDEGASGGAFPAQAACGEPSTAAGCGEESLIDAQGQGAEGGSANCSKQARGAGGFGRDEGGSWAGSHRARLLSVEGIGESVASIFAEHFGYAPILAADPPHT